MEITYLGHSSFKLKSKQGIVITDPFDGKLVGFPFASTSADIVTISHEHPDHNYLTTIGGTPAHEKPWIVRSAGEYEVGGISVFGYKTFHDDSKGSERGVNIVYSIIIDGLNVVHLGDLGHTLSDSFLEQLGTVDVLLCPVGGTFTIDPEKAAEVIASIEPSYVIPMHYKTPRHGEQFAGLKTLEEFEKVYGVSSEPVKSINISSTTLPEQTTLVVLQ